MKMHHSRNSHSGSSSDRNSLASNDGEMTWDLLREAIFFLSSLNTGIPRKGGGGSTLAQMFWSTFF